MNIEFDREEALKQLRLMTFEKRAVAPRSTMGGPGGENQGAASRKVNIISGGGLGGSRSSIYEGAGSSNTDALLSANNAIPKQAPQRIAMKTPSKLSASKMGMGVSNSSGGQLSVGKVKSPSAKALKAPGMTTLASVGMGKAAHIVALQKEAALPAIGAGALAALRTAAAAGGLRGLASTAASYIPRATGAVKNFFKGFGSKPSSSPFSGPRLPGGLLNTRGNRRNYLNNSMNTSSGSPKPFEPSIVDKAIGFFKNVASSDTPRKVLSAGARDLAVRGAKGTANFAYNRGKSATKFGLGAGGLATGYSMMKNPELTFKQHLARATPYATAGAALGTGGVFGLGLPAAAMVKPSMERYLRKKKLIDPKKSLSIGSDFGKKTGILESDAARRRRITSGFSRLSTKDIKSYI